jgi:hypothetical protein
MLWQLSRELMEDGSSVQWIKDAVFAMLMLAMRRYHNRRIAKAMCTAALQL